MLFIALSLLLLRLSSTKGDAALDSFYVAPIKGGWQSCYMYRSVVNMEQCAQACLDFGDGTECGAFNDFGGHCYIYDVASHELMDQCGTFTTKDFSTIFFRINTVSDTCGDAGTLFKL
eukprot:151232_1